MSFDFGNLGGALKISWLAIGCVPPRANVSRPRLVRRSGITTYPPPPSIRRHLILYSDPGEWLASETLNPHCWDVCKKCNPKAFLFAGQVLREYDEHQGLNTTCQNGLRIEGIIQVDRLHDASRQTAAAESSSWRRVA